MVAVCDPHQQAGGRRSRSRNDGSEEDPASTRPTEGRGARVVSTKHCRSGINGMSGWILAGRAPVALASAEITRFLPPRRYLLRSNWLRYNTQA
jgi:hypothetical protein